MEVKFALSYCYDAFSSVLTAVRPSRINPIMYRVPTESVVEDMFEVELSTGKRADCVEPSLLIDMLKVAA